MPSAALGGRRTRVRTSFLRLLRKFECEVVDLVKQWIRKVKTHPSMRGSPLESAVFFAFESRISTLNGVRL